MLSKELFKKVIASTPLLSIDLIVRNTAGSILLGRRINRPAKNFWFVPGGRVLKDETLEDAFIRLIKVELGLDDVISNFKGVYQHFYKDNFSEESFTTHYIVLAYEITVNCELASLPVEQHSDYKWFSISELLNNDEVHIHSKWYFQKDKQADLRFK